MSNKYKNNFAESANNHMYIGMINESSLEKEGGPLIVKKAEGIYLTSYDDEKYFDGISGMYFRNVGHGREEIAKAIYEQLTDVSMNVYAATTPVAVKLAKKLLTLLQEILTKHSSVKGGLRQMNQA